MLYNYLSRANTNRYLHIVYYRHHGPMAVRLQSLGIRLVQIAGLLGWWQAARAIRAEKPAMLHASLWLASAFARILGYVLRVPVLCDIHADVGCYDIMRRTVEKIVVYLPATYRVVGHHVRTSFVATTRVRQKQVVTIPNGVVLPTRTQVSTKDPKRFVIIAVGRLVSLKNFDHILDALSYISPVKRHRIQVYIVGDGPERSNLARKVSLLELENQVSFEGSRDDLTTYYERADCCILPSSTEGLSCVLLEAMAFGVPVITTGVNYTHELVRHNETGYVLSVGDRVGIAQAILGLIAQPALAHKMGLCAREHIAEHYGLDAMVQRLEMLYESMVQDRPQVRSKRC